VDEESERVLFLEVPEEARNTRLDVFVASRQAGLSRSRIQTLVRSGQVRVNGIPSKSSQVLRAGDRIRVVIPPAGPTALEPEAIALDVVFEDDALIVLNKPPGLVVHPAPGHRTGTLVHGLLRHCKDLSGVGGQLRPGIVHRLDKDTSGLMVVAKDQKTHEALSRQFKSGAVRKIYAAVVHGIVKGERGEMDLPIGRHPKERKRMAVLPDGGRRAVTLWARVEDLRPDFSLLSVQPKTGRTHQIRVHLAHAGYPILGDPVYGYGSNWWKRYAAARGIPLEIVRQMLHAQHLGFVHPRREVFVEFHSALPPDMEETLRALRGRA
jgi:23S rRNA pseudouridine1911/1915/1917 synthase